MQHIFKNLLSSSSYTRLNRDRSSAKLRFFYFKTENIKKIVYICNVKVSYLKFSFGWLPMKTPRFEGFFYL